MTRRTFLVTAAAAVAAKTEGVAWTQWGGPHRNFTTESTGLKSSWPATGPKVMWKRPLGEGVSSPSVEGSALYTMYGRPGQEVWAPLDPPTATPPWDHSTPPTRHAHFPYTGVVP